MSYSSSVYDLANRYGRDANLTDREIARLAQHLQTELEEEILYLQTVRKDQP